MTRPSLRSRRKIRRVQVRTPSGRNVQHYERRKPGKAICGTCGAVLKGIPHVLGYQLRTMAKTTKRPERPYGGVLCSECTRRVIIAQSRKLSIA